MVTLRNMRDVLLTLQQEFSSHSGPKIILESEKKNDLNKRLLLLEGEIDGLMKRRIEYSSDANGERCLDYSGLLNEKENQIVQL